MLPALVLGIVALTRQLAGTLMPLAARPPLMCARRVGTRPVVRPRARLVRPARTITTLEISTAIMLLGTVLLVQLAKNQVLGLRLVHRVGLESLVIAPRRRAQPALQVRGAVQVCTYHVLPALVVATAQIMQRLALPAQPESTSTAPLFLTTTTQVTVSPALRGSSRHLRGLRRARLVR